MNYKRIEKSIQFLLKLYDEQNKAGIRKWSNEIFKALCHEYGYKPNSLVHFTPKLVSDIVLADEKCFIQLLEGIDEWTETNDEIVKKDVEALWISMTKYIAENTPFRFNKENIFRMVYWRNIVSNARFQEQIIEQSPEDAYDFYRKAEYLSSHGRHNEALNCYDEAINRNPDYFNYLQGKIELLYKMNRTPEARTVYEKAIATGDDIWSKFELDINITHLMSEKKYYVEAMEYADTAISCVCKHQYNSDIEKWYYTIVKGFNVLLPDLQKMHLSSNLSKKRESFFRTIGYLISRIKKYEENKKKKISLPSGFHYIAPKGISRKRKKKGTKEKEMIEQKNRKNYPGFRKL